MCMCFLQEEDGIRVIGRSGGVGEVSKRQDKEKNKAVVNKGERGKDKEKDKAVVDRSDKDKEKDKAVVDKTDRGKD